MSEPHGRRWLVPLAAAALTATVAELALPTLLGRCVDAAIAGTPVGRWLVPSVLVIAALALAEPVRDLAAGTAAAHRTAGLRRALARHLLAPGTDRRRQLGDRVQRLVGSAADAGQSGVATVLATMSVVPVLGALGALALIDGWLVVGFLAGVGLVALLLRGHVRDAAAVAQRYQGIQASIANRLADALAGARTIGAAGTTDREITRCLRPLPELAVAGTGTWHVLARSSARGALVGPLLQLSVVAVGGFELSAGRMTPGELVAAIQYAALGAGIGGIVGALNRVARARAGTARVTEVLAAPVAGYGDSPLPAGDGTLTFDGVSVAVDGTPVLHDVDLVVPGGATVAVVGASGSGKSVLAALAARLTDPDVGEVRLDGVPMHRLTAGTLRSAVGVAFERPVLLGATVGEAVCLGQPRPDPDTAATSLRLVCADGYVARLPAGLDTPLAEAPMSGGEAQRLGLARAWHAERLLVLDDATSSLDTVTEAQIIRVLTGDRLRTHLVVAHRASTAARCDTVVWLAGGRVRAVAPHQVLWRDPGYRELFRAGVPA